MDFGFEGLINEIEDRFGSIAANIFIGSLFLGAFLWALDLLFSMVLTIHGQLQNETVISIVLAIALRIALAAIFLVIFYGVLKYLNRKVLARAEKKIEEMEKMREEMFAENRQFHVGFYRQFKQILKKHDISIPELEGKIDELYGDLEKEITDINTGIDK